MFLPEMYADGSIRGGEGNIYRAVLADEEILFDRDSMSLRWVHAGRSVSVRTGSVLYGRVSADQFIRIERGCRFERLHAPRIEFCFEAECVESGGTIGRESDVLKPSQLDRRVETAAGRWLVDDRLDVPVNKIIRADLVTTGKGRIRSGARIFGSVKSHKDMRIEKEVEIVGSVVSGRDIYIGSGCRIHGPVLAERAIYVDEGLVIGAANLPTTVSAEYAYIAPGATIHGTVWAHKGGWVIAPADVPANKRPN
jgi:cytoskeletal protein CcmA (bactofilin family)